MNIHQKKLRIINNVVLVTDNNLASIIRRLVSEGHLKLIKSEAPRPSWKDQTPDDFMDRESTRTYRDCIDVWLHKNETVSLDVYEGDTFDGHRTFKNATYTFKGEWWRCSGLTDELDRAFSRHVEGMRRQEEEEKRNKRRLEIANELLGDIAE